MTQEEKMKEIISGILDLKEEKMEKIMSEILDLKEEKMEEIMSELLDLKEEIKELKDFIVKQAMNANYRTRNEF